MYNKKPKVKPLNPSWSTESPITQDTTGRLQTCGFAAFKEHDSWATSGRPGCMACCMACCKSTVTFGIFSHDHLFSVLFRFGLINCSFLIFFALDLPAKITTTWWRHHRLPTLLHTTPLLLLLFSPILCTPAWPLQLAQEENVYP